MKNAPYLLIMMGLLILTVGCSTTKIVTGGVSSSGTLSVQGTVSVPTGTAAQVASLPEKIKSFFASLLNGSAVAYPTSEILPNATVKAVRLSDGVILGETQTDSTGKYTLNNMPSNTIFMVKADKSNVSKTLSVRTLAYLSTSSSTFDVKVETEIAYVAVLNSPVWSTLTGTYSDTKRNAVEALKLKAEINAKDTINTNGVYPDVTSTPSISVVANQIQAFVDTEATNIIVANSDSPLFYTPANGQIVKNPVYFDIYTPAGATEIEYVVNQNGQTFTGTSNVTGSLFSTPARAQGYGWFSLMSNTSGQMRVSKPFVSDWSPFFNFNVMPNGVLPNIGSATLDGLNTEWSSVGGDFLWQDLNRNSDNPLSGGDIKQWRAAQNGGYVYVMAEFNGATPTTGAVYNLSFNLQKTNLLNGNGSKNITYQFIFNGSIWQLNSAYFWDNGSGANFASTAVALTSAGSSPTVFEIQVPQSEITSRIVLDNSGSNPNAPECFMMTFSTNESTCSGSCTNSDWSAGGCVTF